MTRPTFYCSAAHQVGVGEVEGCVQAEVGLHDTPNLLCHVIVHVGTLQRNFPFLPKLQRTLVVSCPDAPLQAACREHLPPAAEGASSSPLLSPSYSMYPVEEHGLWGQPRFTASPHAWGPISSHLSHFYYASSNSHLQGNLFGRAYLHSPAAAMSATRHFSLSTSHPDSSRAGVPSSSLASRFSLPHALESRDGFYLESLEDSDTVELFIWGVWRGLTSVAISGSCCCLMGPENKLVRAVECLMRGDN